MNKDQVKKIKELNLKNDGTGNPIAGVLSIVFNDEICFRNTDDFVIYDDSNELVHAIKVNMDGPQSSAAWPYKICTGYYGNIQFMEGLYNMGNFAKIIDELLYQPGLIDDKQKDMIMEWAKNIRNHSMTPKMPGPYYKDTPKIPPHPPVPEIRDDGLFHASPIAQRTAQNKLLQLITPVLDGDGLTKIKPCIYKKTASDFSEIPALMKSAIEAVQDEKLFYASFSDGKYSAAYNPKDEKTVNTFEANVTKLMPKLGETKNYVLYVEANGVRVDYTFALKCDFSDDEKEQWIENIDTAMENFSATIDPSIATVTKVSNRGYSVDILSDEVEDIGFTDFLYGLDGMSVVRLRYNDKSYMMTPGDDQSYDDFKKGVKGMIPESGDITNAEVTIMGAASVTYTLKVKYYNDADCECSINGVFYNTLAEAVDAAQNGDTISIQKDIAVAAQTMYPIDNEREITVELNNHTITFPDNKSYFIVTDGKLNISGGKLVNAANYVAKVVALPNDNGHESVIVGENLEIEGLYGVIASYANKNTDKYGAKISLKDTTINAVYMGVTINGYLNAISGGVAEVTLDNVTVNASDAESAGIYAAGYGNWTVNNCTFTAADALSLKSGNIAINGGTYTSNGAYKDPAAGNNDGTENTGAALSLTSNDGYAKKLDVVVNSGTFVSENGHAIYEGIAKKNGTPVAAASYATIEVIDGTFDSAADKDSVNITTAADKHVLKGGSYNTDVTAFCEDGYVARAIDGRFVVGEATPEEEVDNVIENVEREGLVIEPDPSLERTYNIVTDNGAIADSGLFDQLAALPNLKSIVINDGDGHELTYLAGSTSLEAFKTAVDELVPQHNLDEEVVFTMVVDFNE